MEPALLAQAQDDATELAIRAQERAGLDLLTDGEIRRESYSNHFATALEGVDVDNPGTALDRCGHPNPVPRIVGPDPPPAPRCRCATWSSSARHTDRPVKMTVPGPFTMSQQAQNDHYPDLESAAMDYAAAVNAEVKDLFAAGADVVQIDEPYLQARPDAARAYGLAALTAALDGVTGTTAVHLCFGYAAIIHERPSGYSFLPELAGCPVDQISIETGAVRARPRRAGRPRRQDDHPRGDRPVDARGRDRRRSSPTRVRRAFRVPAAGAARDRAGLRNEVPAAGVRGRARCARWPGAAALLRAEIRERTLRCSSSPRTTSPSSPSARWGTAHDPRHGRGPDGAGPPPARVRP